jgi:hypothetical protein
MNIKIGVHEYEKNTLALCSCEQKCTSIPFFTKWRNFAMPTGTQYIRLNLLTSRYVCDHNKTAIICEACFLNSPQGANFPPLGKGSPLYALQTYAKELST